MPFLKLDQTILRSSLWVDRDLRSLFITCLILAEPHEFAEPLPTLHVDSLTETGFVLPPGWYGFIRAAGTYLIALDGVEKERPGEGLDVLRRLCAPDADSRSQEYEGRRLARVNGGYVVLNYMKYRDFDHSAADRMRRLRARNKKAKTEQAVQQVQPMTDGVTPNADSVRRNVTYVRSASASASAFDLDLKEPVSTKELVGREATVVPVVPADIVQPFVESRGLGSELNGVVAGFLRSRMTSPAIMAILDLHLSGEMGYLKASPEELVLAVQEYAASTGPERGFSAAYFAGFVRRVRGRLANKREAEHIKAVEIERQEEARDRARSAPLRSPAAMVAEATNRLRRERFAAERPEVWAQLRAKAEGDVRVHTEPMRTAMIEGALDFSIRDWERAHEHENQEPQGKAAEGEAKPQERQANPAQAAPGASDRPPGVRADQRRVSGEHPGRRVGDEDGPLGPLAGGQGDVGPGADDGHPAPDRRALRGDAGVAGPGHGGGVDADDRTRQGPGSGRRRFRPDERRGDPGEYARGFSDDWGF